MRLVSVDPANDSDLPPGQHATTEFPVESTETPPRVRRGEWTLTIAVGARVLRTWDWRAFRGLPHERFSVDLHSVLGWSKLATDWEGVPVQVLLADLEAEAEFARIDTYGDYTTNLPLEDLLEMPTWIADSYQGQPIAADHGGPARLLVPHLYLWKSAKWIRAISLTDHDQPGTRERGGLHNYGDPWRQQRYRDD
jgi:DMSO/TMAO reductase YedYZ molybdopterin-dependent catalytic subunit